MDAKEIADVVTSALRAKYPEVKTFGERLGRESFTLDFTIGQDSGSISIELNPEDLICIECSGMDTSPANLVPVSDEEVFDVACIHNLPRLRNWRKLTDEERTIFDQGSEELVARLWKRRGG